MFVEDLEGRTLLAAVIATPPVVTRPVTAPPQNTPPTITRPVVVTRPASQPLDAHAHKGGKSADHRKDGDAPSGVRQDGAHRQDAGRH